VVATTSPASAQHSCPDCIILGAKLSTAAADLCWLAALLCCCAAAAGVTCPGSPTACPSGFYCAAKFDAGVGERCIPLPKYAGQEGAPCLPNNLPVSCFACCGMLSTTVAGVYISYVLHYMQLTAEISSNLTVRQLSSAAAADLQCGDLCSC
jgi:hypothetical protein